MFSVDPRSCGKQEVHWSPRGDPQVPLSLDKIWSKSADGLGAVPSGVTAGLPLLLLASPSTIAGTDGCPAARTWLSGLLEKTFLQVDAAQSRADVAPERSAGACQQAAALTAAKRGSHLRSRARAGEARPGPGPITSSGRDRGFRSAARSRCAEPVPLPGSAARRECLARQDRRQPRRAESSSR